MYHIVPQNMVRERTVRSYLLFFTSDRLALGSCFLQIACKLRTIVDMCWPGKCFDHNGSDWICKICVHVANCKHCVSWTLRKTAHSYHTIARCAMGLRTKSKGVHLDVVTRGKSQKRHHYDEFMKVLHNRRHVWEQGEESTLANVARIETRSLSRSPQLAQKKRRDRPIPR